MDLAGRRRIEALQQAVEGAGTASLTMIQPLSQRRISPGTSEKSVKQRCQVKAGPPDDKGEPPPAGDLFESLAALAGIFTCCVHLRRVRDVEEVMRNPELLDGGGFCGSQVEMPENLERVAIDDLAIQSTGEMQA
jgi:hypothetical protein